MRSCGLLTRVARFLRPHPLSEHQTLLSTLTLLPLLIKRLNRLETISDLRCLVVSSNSDEYGRLEFTEPLFQKETYDGRRHALKAEQRLLERLLHEMPLCHTQESSPKLLSKVEVEWVLEVVTTATGAEEPYDYTRLAWLGDAVVFLIAVALEYNQ
ncbi:unnamed protein product, partial [Durusdinium trenchii]